MRRDTGDKEVIDAVNARLVHRVKDCRQRRIEMQTRDTLGQVSCAVVLGDLLSQWHLILRRVFELLEAEREGADLACFRFRRETSKCRRIEAGGQEKPDRHIGDEMMLNTVEQHFAKALAWRIFFGGLSEGLGGIEEGC